LSFHLKPRVTTTHKAMCTTNELKAYCFRCTERALCQQWLGEGGVITVTDEGLTRM